MPHEIPTGWTIDTYAAHNEALRMAQERLDAERDRRYTEVAAEREKALKIKETADLAALELAREIQTYKDEKANELREQIASERGVYLRRDEYAAAHAALIDKVDAQMKPLNDFVSSQQGRREGVSMSAAVLYAAILIAIAVVSVVIATR